MAKDSTLARSLHDIGLAAWFGGSLMGATPGSTGTGLALAATAYSRMLGAKLEQADGAPVEDGTTPTSGTPPQAAKAQRQLTVLQWAIPALTGATLAVNARMGEQQRPKSVATGLLHTPRRWAPMAAVPLLAATALAASARRRRGPDMAGQAVVIEPDATTTTLDSSAASLAGR